MTSVRDIAVRPLLIRIAAFGLLLAVAAGPISFAWEASGEIDAARQRLDKARDLAGRATPVPPLVAPDGEALLAAFRGRLETLAGSGPVVVDWTSLEADPSRPDLPRLRATLRGTAGGLHGLLHALETGAPLVALEEADLGIERPADIEIGRPTIMRLALTARGVIAATQPSPATARRIP